MRINKPPNHTPISVRFATATITFIWIAMTAYSIPAYLWRDLRLNSKTLKMECVRVNVDREIYVIYVYVVRVANYFVPLAINWISYGGIIYRTKVSLSKVCGR